ncbi:MAG: transporter substrate-binding domain-containing protein [Desulfobacterales bacterium]|nr:transporter substrate-binding domain-containing protein [Desulfobacterales bacterium]
MKQAVILFWIIGFLGLNGDAFAQLPPIPLATGEWAPYASQGMEGYGVFSEIVSAAFHEAGIEPRYQFYPWKRAGEYARDGRVFAAFPYKITDERELIYDFSEPVMMSTGRFFYLKSRFPQGIEFQELADLTGFRIGGVLGYWYETEFEKAGLTVEYVSTDSQNFKKLFADRIDLVACDELVGWELINRLYPQKASQFATIEKPMNEDALRLMISRTYPDAAEITSRFNAALKRLVAQGNVKEILAGQGLQDYHPPE